MKPTNIWHGVASLTALLGTQYLRHTRDLKTAVVALVMAVICYYAGMKQAR